MCMYICIMMIGSIVGLEGLPLTPVQVVVCVVQDNPRIHIIHLQKVRRHASQPHDGSGISLDPFCSTRAERLAHIACCGLRAKAMSLQERMSGVKDDVK